MPGNRQTAYHPFRVSGVSSLSSTRDQTTFHGPTIAHSSVSSLNLCMPTVQIFPSHLHILSTQVTFAKSLGDSVDHVR